MTTKHKDVTERLIQINPALAKEARKVLDTNKSAVRRYGLFVVHIDELEQMLVAGLGLVLVALEQHVRTLGEFAGQAGVAGLVHQELLIAAGRGLGVQGELLVAAVGIVAEQVPVAAVHSLLHFLLAVQSFTPSVLP